MRITLLTAHSEHGEPQHRYVASRIAQAYPEELQAIIVATGVRHSSLAKIGRWGRRYTPRQLISRLLARIYNLATRADMHRQEALRSVLFPGGESGVMPRDDLVHLVTSHNSLECIKLLESLNPDIVVVYGTLIIGKKVIESSNRIINLHTGFSPTYRGSDTIFWPLHNEELDNLGVTVHRLDPGLDSGPILARGKPSIEPGDDENKLFAKAVKLGTELLCRAIKRETQNDSRPIVQQLNLGREYRSVERTLGAELRTRNILRQSSFLKARSEWWEEY